MRRPILSAKRTLAQAPLLAAVLGVAVVVTALLAGIPRYLDLAAVDSARGTLAASPVRASTVELRIRLADDAAAQDAAVQSVFSQEFPPGSVVITRSVTSDPVAAMVPVNGAEPVETAIVLAADDDAQQRVDLTEGSWPAADGEGALQAEAATALGLSVGDEVVIGGTSVAIVGTWLPLDAGDRQWFDDPLVTAGVADDAVGPLYVTESQLAALDVSPFARWIIVPALTTITPGQLGDLADALRGLDLALREADVAGSGLILEGDLGDTLSTLGRSTASVRGVSPIPIVLAAAIGAVAIAQLARLLAAARARETLLLRARGRSRGQAVVASIIETIAVIVPATALGAGIALVVVPTEAVPPTLAWLTAAAVAVIACVILVVVAVRTSADPDTDRSRVASGVTLGAVVLSVIAAGVSLWQFRLYGSPVITTADGRQVVDPVAVLAPSLTLIACAFLALAAFAPLAALVERGASRSRGATAPLAARQVARRVGTFAVPVLLVSLAVGGTTLAAAYSGTWSALNAAAGELRNGGAVRAVLPSSGIVGSAATLVSPATLDLDQQTSAPVVRVDAVIGEQPVSLLELDADAASDVMLDLGGDLDTNALGQAIAVPRAGLELPAEATTLELVTTTTVTTADDAPLTPRQGETAVVAWLVDDRGSMVRLVLDGATDLPPAAGSWRLLAVDFDFRTGVNEASYSFSVTSVNAGGSGGDIPLPTEPWQLQLEASSDLGGAGAEAHETGIGVDLDEVAIGPTLSVRLMPEASGPAPAVITNALADRLGLATGDEAVLRYAGSGSEVHVVIADAVALLPGTTGSWGAVVDLAAADEELLRAGSSIQAPNQLWVSSSDPDATAAALRDTTPRGTDVTTASTGTGGELLRPVTYALLGGGVGGLLLAAAAIAAAVAALDRERRSEVPVLKSVGLSNAQQARARRTELGAVLLFAAIAGALGGLLVSALTIGDLARAAVLDAPPALVSGISIDWLPYAVILLAAAVAVGAIVVVAGTRVRRAAVDATGREVEA
jgi:hypothetical protein